MKPRKININQSFIGRPCELDLLHKIGNEQNPAIIITYGRRRVGKTELLEQTYRDRNIFKFEGLEGKPQEEQREHVLEELAEYCDDPYLTKLKLNSWKEIFKLIHTKISKDYANKEVTLYFEELQWLANYQADFVSDLKYAWDNYFRHLPKLIVILCGSSPSYMVSKVLKSKALHNRSQWEIPLQPFDLAETREFMSKHNLHSVMDAYLSVGGIPEYLKKLQNNPSVFLALCQQSFVPGGFFTNEYQRIFTSSLAENKHYQAIIEFLSHKKFATRTEILKHLKIKSSGTISEVLYDLVTCGFITQYTPYNLSEKSTLARYQISDNYLQFYFKFIKPLHQRITYGDFKQNPNNAIKIDDYYKWLGFAFERLCRQQHQLIANILGFGSVKYKFGAFYNRATNTEKPGFQIDLIFEREDRVFTVCEIKYLQSKVTSSVIDEVERKLELLPNPKNHTIHRVLISANGAEESLINRAYFDNILTLEDLFQ